LKSKQVQEFKKTEIGKVPLGWEVNKIENFLSAEKGSIKIGPFGSQIKKEFFVSKGLKVYGQENIFKNDFSLGSRYITNERFDMLSSCELKPNDLIISMMGTIGFMVIVPKNIQKGIMDSHLLRIRIDENKINNKFLLYALRSPIIQNQIDSFSVGTIMPGLNSKIIKQLFFPIPKLSEQEKIAKILSDLDTKIENLQKQNKVLEQTAQTLFKSWFVDFDGVTEFDDSELGKIPKGWKVEHLVDNCNIITGKLNSNAAINNGRYSFFTCAKENYKTNTYSFDCEAILLAGNNAVGDFSVKYFSGKFDVYQRTYVITIKDSSSLDYFYLLLSIKKALEFFQSISYGTATKYLTMTILEPFPILIPDSNSLKKFSQITNPFLKQIMKNYTELENLTNIRNSLLPKLMSGEIRV